MSGPVSAFLEAEVAERVRERGLVIWLDASPISDIFGLRKASIHIWNGLLVLMASPLSLFPVSGAGGFEHRRRCAVRSLPRHEADLHVQIVPRCPRIGTDPMRRTCH